MLDVFQCSIHGETNLEKCKTCKDHQPREPRGETGKTMVKLRECRQATSAMSVEDMMTLIQNAPPGPWPTDWDKWDNVHEAHRQLATDYIEHITSYPDTYKGRGIIIAGGAQPLPHKGLPHGYMPCIWVLVNKLRRLGCNLPIQVWYLGDLEMDAYLKKILKPFGVECVDARKVEELYPSRINCGWELKVYATIHCPFEEVLFLDADNAPIQIDPAFLFGTEQYQTHGSIFWPDYDCWKLQAGVWKVFGMPHRDEAAFESGQFLVNKRACWREINLALWYAEHSDFVFRHVYGDKEVFHLAWRRLQRDYAMTATPPAWIEHTIVQHDFLGRQILLHRVQDKWRLHGGNRRVSLPDEDLHFDLVKSLREIWPGRLWRNHLPSRAELRLMRAFTNQTYLYRRIGQDERNLTLGPGGKVGDGGAECERYWSVFQDASVLGDHDCMLVLSSEDKPTCILTEQAEGVWRGRWLEYERCEVEMTPVAAVKTFTPTKVEDSVADGIKEVLRQHAIEYDDRTLAYVVERLVNVETVIAEADHGTV